MSFVFDKEHAEKIKKSLETVGQLQFALKEKGTANILVGRHRKYADPNWKEIEIEVKDDLHRELIIIHSQVQRGMSDEEAKMRVTRIAKILERQGVPKQKICSRIIEKQLTPWSERHLRRLIPKEYKEQAKARHTKHVDSHPSTFTTKSADIYPQTPSPADLKQPEKVKRARTALDNLAQSTQDDTPSYPYPDCICNKCSHRNDCY